MLLKTPRLINGKRSQETKLDYFGNKIEIGDVICRCYSASPDIGIVASISDKSIEMTCERVTKQVNHTKSGKSTYVVNSMPYAERDFQSALHILAKHNSTKRIWCYSNKSAYAPRCNNQIINLTKLNLI